jgi:hypothetical protein
MPLTPFPVDEFRGLNLTIDPTELGTAGAVDVSNLDFDRPGELRTRPGRKLHTANDSATFSGGSPYRLVYVRGLQQVVALNATLGGGSTLAAYDINGSTVTTATINADTGPPVDIAPFGTATQGSVAYTISLRGISRWNGSTLTNVGTTTTPRGGFLALWAPHARLVAGYCAVNSGPLDSRVHFSNAGDPETWTYGAGPPETGDWVDLEPRNGEWITGVQALGNSVIVLKQTRAYIFYGESTHSDGTAEFLFRSVSLGDAVATPGTLLSGRVSADSDFVYWLGSRGVYRMNEGGASALISEAITPIFENSATYGTFSHIAATSDRVYVGGDTTTLVLQKNTGQWTIYSFVSQAILPIQPRTATKPIPLPRETWLMSAGRLVELDSATTTDLGSAITWSYTTGYSSAGGYFRQRIVSSGERKNHFKVDLLGSGTVTHQVLTLNGRPNDVADTGGSVTLGTAPRSREVPGGAALAARTSRTSCPAQARRS